MQRVSVRDGNNAQGDKDAHRVRLCPSSALQVQIKQPPLLFTHCSPHQCVRFARLCPSALFLLLRLLPLQVEVQKLLLSFAHCDLHLFVRPVRPVMLHPTAWSILLLPAMPCHHRWR